jgi:hypothetical protein
MRLHGIRHESYHEDHYMIFFPENVVRLMKLAGFKSASFKYLRFPRKMDVFALIAIKIYFWRKDCLYKRFNVIGIKSN